MCFSLKRRANRIETNPGMALSACVLFSRSLLCSIPLPRTRRCTKTMVGRTFLARETPCCQLVWHYDPRTPSISGSHLQAPPKNWFHVAGARCSNSNEKKNPWDLQCITNIIRMCAHTRGGGGGVRVSRFCLFHSSYAYSQIISGIMTVLLRI